MSDLTDLLIKLIPIFPLLAVISNGLLGSRYSHDVAHRLAWGSVGLSFLCTVGVFTDVLRTGASREVIDLTDDALSTRPAKSPRYPSSFYSSQFQAPSSGISAPHARQLHPVNDEFEPSTQDLTQSDDGPQRELYGSFGMSPFLCA